MPTPVSPTFFARPTLDVAPRLIGKVLSMGRCMGRIVEVEAYTDDLASHARTRTARSGIMYDTYGMVYVYLIYGMYHCLNFTTDKDSAGAVLIRAIEPLSGIEIMRRRRGISAPHTLCNGPGKLCESFGIDDKLNWTPVGDRLQLFSGRAGVVETGPRIGITKATELHWRFYEQGNPFVSR